MCVVLDEGRVVFSGSPSELAASDIDLTHFGEVEVGGGSTTTDAAADDAATGDGGKPVDFVAGGDADDAKNASKDQGAGDGDGNEGGNGGASTGLYGMLVAVVSIPPFPEDDCLKFGSNNLASPASPPLTERRRGDGDRCRELEYLRRVPGDRAVVRGSLSPSHPRHERRHDWRRYLACQLV